MFENIGGKIKALAKGLCWAGIIACIIYGIFNLIWFSKASDGASITLLIDGIIWMIFGPILSWVSCFCLYGFGYVIDKLESANQELVQINQRLGQIKMGGTTFVAGENNLPAMASVNPEQLLENAKVFLEDRNFAKVIESCDCVLQQDVKNVPAYLCKLLAEMQVTTQEALADCKAPLEGKDSYQKILRFGDESLKSVLTKYNEEIKGRILTEQKNGLYQKAKQAIADSDYIRAIGLLAQIPDFEDVDELLPICREKAQEQWNEEKKENEELVAKRKKVIIKFSLTGLAVAILITAGILIGLKIYHSSDSYLFETKDDGNGGVIITGYRDNEATEIKIPATIGEKKVTGIGYDAFWGCRSLTSVTIPDSVTSIGDYAFYYCSGLKRITFQGTKVQWNAISKGDYWNYNTSSYTIHCTDGFIYY